MIQFRQINLGGGKLSGRDKWKLGLAGFALAIVAVLVMIVTVVLGAISFGIRSILSLPSLLSGARQRNRAPQRKDAPRESSEEDQTATPETSPAFARQSPPRETSRPASGQTIDMHQDSNGRWE